MEERQKWDDGAIMRRKELKRINTRKRDRKKEKKKLNNNDSNKNTAFIPK